MLHCLALDEGELSLKRFGDDKHQISTKKDFCSKCEWLRSCVVDAGFARMREMTMWNFVWFCVLITLIIGACFPPLAPFIVCFWLIVLVVLAWIFDPRRVAYEPPHSAVSRVVPHSPPVPASGAQVPEQPDTFLFIANTIDWLLTHWWVLLAIAIGLVFLRTAYLVLRKRALIRAVAICLPLEMTRCEPLEPRERFEATEAIFRRFGISGQVAVNRARPRALNVNMNDAGAYFRGAEYVAEHRRAEDRSFVMRRLVVRWLFDSFAALAGDMKSTDVAWSKALQAMDIWYRESRVTNREPINLSRLPNLAKAMNLPYDLNDPSFRGQLDKANRRSLPKGFFTFWLATHLFDYKRYLRYGLVVTGDNGRERWMEFEGRNAFEAMRMYQAWQALRLDDWLRHNP
jgi:hypothetical protein